MTLRDYTANVISASKVVPDGNFKDSKASGVWDINEALDLIKGGNWPNAANINPDAFVDALFQCHLYDGTGSQQTITNNIDFTKGGLIITKRRDSSTGNGPYWNDTERGVTNYVRSDSDGGTGAQNTSSTGAVVSTSSTGYAVGTFNGWNNSSGEYVSWTFRKQPKFFDIVTYTGDASDQVVSHSLGSTPGMIIIKATSTSGDWTVYHRGLSNNGSNYSIKLNSTAAETNTGGLVATSSTFTLYDTANVNTNGTTYVAYLFAHNNNDGGFGEPGDQDIIKCGSYTNSGSGVEVNLGFEPQFMVFKRTDSSGNWGVVDSMRGIPTPVTSAGDNSNQLRWNLTNAENAEYHPFPTPTGFKVVGAAGGGGGGSGTFIYMAIRRGGMQTPTTASDVFHVQSQSNADAYSVGFPTDLILLNKTGGSSANTYVGSRLTGNSKYLVTSTDAAEATSTDLWTFDGATTKNDFDQGASTSAAWVGWHWARARGYFDVVTYTGTGSARTVSHNLGVAPEMMWVKSRETVLNATDWWVFHKNLSTPADDSLRLNSTGAENTGNGALLWNSTMPTSSVFSLGTYTSVNQSSKNFIAYLFATAAGVSKVGSYTGNGGTQNIDCGFSGGTGARFVLIKNADATGSWVIFDTTRGLVAGNDNYLKLESTSAEGGGYDFIDPLESGFTINQTGGVVLNESGETYIFYAIA